MKFSLMKPNNWDWRLGPLAMMRNITK